MKKLRELRGTEFYSYQGMINFPDGRNPMIADGKTATLLVGGWQDSENDFGITLIFNETDEDILEAFKCYDDIDRAISDARLFAQLLDCDLTKEFLSDFGFEVI